MTLDSEQSAANRQLEIYGQLLRIRGGYDAFLPRLYTSVCRKACALGNQKVAIVSCNCLYVVVSVLEEWCK